MKNKILLYLALLLPGYTDAVYAADTIAIVPQPLNVQSFPGEFRLDSKTTISVPDNDELKSIAGKLAEEIRRFTGLHLRLAPENKTKNTILVTTANAPDSLGREGYLLSVRPGRIVIRAPAPNGVFYGVQSLIQLLPREAAAEKTVLLPSVSIVDKPRFSWRGLMLDVGRYFYPVEFIKKFIDYMAVHKLNTFHWHLTEDHGWRIEIRKYPELVKKGAVRAGTQHGYGQHEVTRTPHWGYYTREQIREVVAYAGERYINVVPEIEMPGHSLAALTAYPELSCTGGPFEIPLRWGIQKDIYCAGNEQTFEFLEDVLSEVMELFPSPLIHIGGDEARKDRWEVCPRCQARIKAEGLGGEAGLQSYFIKRIERFVAGKGRRIIGWDEILEGGLAPNAVVMSWRGTKGGIAAAKLKHDVIMTPNTHCYFDYYQGEPYLEPVVHRGLVTLQDVYSYEPVPEELMPEERAFVKGVQGNIWSEFIHSPGKVEYMTYPRAAALAEVAWSEPDSKNWNDFLRRMQHLYQTYDLLGINYSRSAYNVWHTVIIDSTDMKATVKLESQHYDAEIHYTLDGSAPVAGSRLYEGPIEVAVPGTIKAAAFRHGKRISKISISSAAIVPLKETNE